VIAFLPLAHRTRWRR